MDSDLKEVVNMVASEYRRKPFGELHALIDQGPVCFEREHDGKIYSFEINASRLGENGVRVQVLGEPPGFLASVRGFAEYFGKIVEGKATWF